MKKLTGSFPIKIFLIALVGLSVVALGSLPVSAHMHSGMGRTILNERDFLIHMIPHHEEAISAAAYLAENAERAALRDFAHRVIETQSEEVEMMEFYLEAWYPDADHDVAYSPMMRELDNLQGDELERAFLQDMIVHHMEAVMMAQQLLRRGLARHDEVAALAVQIRDDQRAEIALMRDWLSQWYSTGFATGRRDGVMMMWNGWSGWWFLMMGIGLIAVIALIVLTVWLIGRALSGSTSAPSASKTPRELLDMRYAKGEMSREEYLEARKDLKT